MALGATPSLSSIKSALASAAYNLSSFITAAGKQGIWDRQSNFAYYAAVSFGANVASLDFGFEYSWQDAIITSSGYGWVIDSKPSWLTVYPSVGGSGDTTITITVDASTVNRNEPIIFRQSSTGSTFRLYIYRVTNQ